MCSSRSLAAVSAYRQSRNVLYSADSAATAPEGTERKLQGYSHSHPGRGSFPARNAAGVLNTPKLTKKELSPWVKWGGMFGFFLFG